MNGVLDASMTLAWLLRRADETEAALADQTLRNLASDSWLVPVIWHAEIGNALLRCERTGLIPQAQTNFFLEKLFDAPIATDAESQQHRLISVLTLARTCGLTAYDAVYLELALRTGRMMATFDRKLADAARQAGVRVYGDAA